MPVESASDRASFFNDAEFAVAALYTPPGGGDPVPCTVVYDHERKDPFEVDTGSGSGMRAARAWQGAQMNAGEVGSVAKGGVLQLGTLVAGVFVADGDRLTISARPRLDETGEWWTVDLTKT